MLYSSYDRSYKAQSVCQRTFSLLSVPETLHGFESCIQQRTEEDNLSPFDSKIACLCQSIEINNKHVFLSCHFILTPIYPSNLTSVVICNIWYLSWFIAYKWYPFISFTNYLLGIILILNYIFVSYNVVCIVHSPWLWSVTSTHFQMRANVLLPLSAIGADGYCRWSLCPSVR